LQIICVFQDFGCANLFKLARDDQFAETDQNSQRRQDASRRCVRLPGGLDRDPFSIRGPTQTDQNGRFESSVCVGLLKMP
jgi:hypothetical protein